MSLSKNILTPRQLMRCSLGSVLRFSRCFVGFITKKCVKSMAILRLIFNKRIIYRKLYLFIFDTKMTVSPRKVRHTSSSQDVRLRLAAKYLHIDNFDQTLKKVWIFSVSLLYMLSSCEVFLPVWWPPAGRECRRFRCPGQMSH